jgi:hypothetical protein
LPAKDVKIAGMRIAMQRLLNLQGKTVHPTPYVRRTGRQPNTNPRRRNNHRDGRMAPPAAEPKNVSKREGNMPSDQIA